MPTRTDPAAVTNPRWSLGACHQIARGWALCHAVEVPLAPAAINFGLAGVLAAAMAVVWYFALHTPTALARAAHMLWGISGA